MKNKEGKVIRAIGENFIVLSDDKKYKCKVRGNLKEALIIVGDNVVFEQLEPEEGIINKLFPRHNSLLRPKISNVDQFIIVMSAIEPDFSTLLLDKFLVVAEFNNIKPIVYVSKTDLLTPQDKDSLMKELEKYYKIGYQIITDYIKLKPILKEKITVLGGQTGVGKSTLLNKLDSTLNLATNQISKALNRGKHTTRYVSLLPIEGGLVADTPGFSAFDLSDMTKDDIRTNFIEFNNYSCKYRTCQHKSEPECAIKEAVKNNEIATSRYENYLKLIGGEN